MESSSHARPQQHDTPRHEAPYHDALQLRDRAPLQGGLLDTSRLLQPRAPGIAAPSANADGLDHTASGEGCDAAGAEGSAFDRAPDPARDPAREALERTCLTVKRIALDIGMPRATLEAYRLGTRRMPQSARVRLGTYLASHAAMLDGLAQALMTPAKVADV